MRSQPRAASPMAVQGAGPVSWEPGGPSWSAAAVEIPPLTLPAAASAAAPFPGRAAPRRTVRAAPSAARLPRSSGSRGPTAPAPGCRARRWAGGRWEIGPPGAAADHGAETWRAGCLRGGVLLRQSAGEIPALLLQHALLGEIRGVRGHPDSRASLERRGGCLRLGGSAWAARCPGACRAVPRSFLSWRHLGAFLRGRKTTVAPCQEGTLRGGHHPCCQG